MISDPKYSIIVPAKNGGMYLPACIESILSQYSMDFELIVSDDNSTDSTMSYLRSIDDTRLVILSPPQGFSMAEHWEWALGQARGKWMIFVGQDDGLQSYFFQLADKLTETADASGLRVIASRRGYFFWPGCELSYGDIAVSFGASNRFRVLPTRLMGWTALVGIRDYFELPQMYTTSLFHRSVLNRVRTIQGGSIFVTHPQDANLAAIAYSLTRAYLYSDIPLGWVGSSPKSAGLAVTSDSSRDSDSLRSAYLDSIGKSKLGFNPSIGDFSIGSTSLYFWGALLQTRSLRRRAGDGLLSSSFARRLVFASAVRELSASGEASERMTALKRAARKNGLSAPAILWSSRGLLAFARRLLQLAIGSWETLSVFRLSQASLAMRETAFLIKRSEAPTLSLRDAGELARRSIKTAQIM